MGVSVETSRPLNSGDIQASEQWTQWDALERNFEMFFVNLPKSILCREVSFVKRSRGVLYRESCHEDVLYREAMKVSNSWSMYAEST